MKLIDVLNNISLERREVMVALISPIPDECITGLISGIGEDFIEIQHTLIPFNAIQYIDVKQKR